MTRRAWWLFAGVAVLWGLPYLFIRVAVDAGIAPVTVVWLRTTGAALVLLPVAAVRGSLRPLLPRWPWVLTLTAVQVTASFLLITYSEQRIASSLAGLLVAAEPLFVAVLALGLSRADRPDARQGVGLVVGLAGVATLLGLDLGSLGGDGLTGAALVLLAALLYALAALLVPRITANDDPVGAIVAVLAVNSIVLVPIAIPTLPHRMPTADVTAALLALALLCTAAAFLAYFMLIGEAGPGRATVVFYVTPVVSVAAGVTFLNERVTDGMFLGIVLITAGTWAATTTHRRAQGENNS